jgi:hypothetical protein
MNDMGDDMTSDMLRTVDRVFDTHCGRDLRESAESGAWPAGLWQALAETGLDRVALPEAAGGPGLAFADAIESDGINEGMAQLIQSCRDRGGVCNTESNSWPQRLAVMLLAQTGNENAIMPIVESLFFADHDDVRIAAEEGLLELGMLLPEMYVED